MEKSIFAVLIGKTCHSAAILETPQAIILGYIYIYIKLHKHMKRHKNCMCKIITKEPISTDDISIAHARHTSFMALYKVPRRDMMLSTLPTRPLKQM